MPSLKRIKTRIVSVKNTQKITKAMKLIAAARLRKAQAAVVAGRPYAEKLAQMITDVQTRSGAAEGEAPHPLLTRREPVRKIALLLISADRGLAGGLNSNLNRMVERWLLEPNASGSTRALEVELIVVGRKGREYFRRRKANIASELAGVGGEQIDEQARELAQLVTKAFLDEKYDEVYLAYNLFRSAISQLPRVEQLLPVAAAAKSDGPVGVDFDFEPSKDELLDRLVPMFVESQIRRALLEAAASFFGAQMSAMESASKNAKEMISSLTLEYNRARQASITKELMEIIGGAEALKG